MSTGRETLGGLGREGEGRAMRGGGGGRGSGYDMKTIQRSTCSCIKCIHQDVLE